MTALRCFVAVLAVVLAGVVCARARAGWVSPGERIVRLEARIAHDRAVLRSAGSFRPIGGGWSIWIAARRAVVVEASRRDLAASARRLAALQALRGPVGAWSCIHRYEGSWRDPAAPYFGGLQMDLSFQRRYGLALLEHRGTADHWLPDDQMIVAERARRSGRGFYPWPNTARACGLI